MENFNRYWTVINTIFSRNNRQHKNYEPTEQVPQVRIIYGAQIFNSLTVYLSVRGFPI